MRQTCRDAASRSRAGRRHGARHRRAAGHADCGRTRDARRHARQAGRCDVCGGDRRSTRARRCSWKKGARAKRSSSPTISTRSASQLPSRGWKRCSENGCSARERSQPTRWKNVSSTNDSCRPSARCSPRRRCPTGGEIVPQLRLLAVREIPYVRVANRRSETGAPSARPAQAVGARMYARSDGASRKRRVRKTAFRSHYMKARSGTCTTSIQTWLARKYRQRLYREIKNEARRAALVSSR